MSFNERVGSLKRKHAELETRIHDAFKNAYHDERAIKALKIEKLHVKEEIERLAQSAA